MRCLPDLSWAEVVLRIVLAAGLGGAIGLERELREREAGLRTHLLVSVGAALFTMVSAYAWTDWRFSTEEGLVFDPTRIAAQVVTETDAWTLVEGVADAAAAARVTAPARDLV